MFLKELKKFSYENWWVFILLFSALLIVWITNNWNLIEILFLFLANLIANLFIMVMQNNYSNKKNKIWSTYHILATSIFALISIYWLIYLDQYQYLIWQITYWLAAIKAFTFYNYSKDLKFLSEKTFILINLLLFIIFIKYIDYKNFQILQAIWFSLITTWLVSINDNLRYWLNIIWIFSLILWSLWWVIYSFNYWNLDWIALWFFILTLTVFIYYIKLIKKYI